MKKVVVILANIILFTAACSPKPEPHFAIIPQQCKIGAGQRMAISLEGSNMPSSGEVTWSASKGNLDPTTGLTVFYTAPLEPDTVIINAVFEANGVTYPNTLTCEVIGIEPVASPTDSPTDLPPTPEVMSNPSLTNTIAITEVMSTPCGGGSGTVPNRNEYIELYNYGSDSVDVRDWWIATTGGGDGTPDQIVPWNTANPGVYLGSNVLVNESIIPPGRFAIVLSPKYPIGAGENFMPYTFPKDTIILSFSASKYLGNDTIGLVGTKSDMSLTVIALYQGTKIFMSNIVSTYGTPAGGSSPIIQDDRLDKFPYPLGDCRSMERINASGPDTISNWRDIAAGNPGRGNYSDN